MKAATSLRWTFLVLAILLSIDWGLIEYEAWRAGSRGMVVSVSIEPRAATDTPAAARLVGESAQVSRVSPRGTILPLDRLPGATQWVGTRAWFRGLQISLPESALVEVDSITVQIGAQRFRYDSEAIAREWRREIANPESVTLLAPAAIRSRPSGIPVFAEVINWPGDFQMLWGTLRDGNALRLVIVLLLWFGSRRLAKLGPGADSAGETITRWVRWGLIAYSGLGVLPTMISRLCCSFDVEHLEGVQALGIWSISNGAGLYQIPNADHSGNIYTPAYYLLGAAWSQLFGLSLPALRVLSWVMLAITAASSVRIARYLTGRWQDGLLWLPIYLLMFDYYGWIDNANKDPMHVALAMAGFAALARSLHVKEKGGADLAGVAAGVLWALAFMTKQSHVTAVATTMAVLLVSARRQFWVTGLTFGVACLAMTGTFQSIWEDYWLWTFVVPRGHGFSMVVLGRQLLMFVSVAAGLFVVAGALLMSGKARDEGVWLAGSGRTRVAFVAFLAGSLLTGFLSVGKDRGGAYALMPAVAAVALLVSIALSRPRTTKHAILFPLLLLAMTNPFDRWVGEEDRRTAQLLVERIRSEPGEVWVPFHGWFNVLAGKQPHVAQFCIGEWTASGRPFPTAVLEALEEQRFALVITDFNSPDFGSTNTADEPFLTLARHYRADEHIPLEDAFIQTEGWTNVPRILWRPRK